MMRNDCLYVAFALIVCLAISITEASDLPDPDAWWKFDETLGTVAEDAMGDADGTLLNGPEWTAGLVDGALSFDGLDDCVAAAGYKGITGTSSRTCSACIKPIFEPFSFDPIIMMIASWGESAPGEKWMFYVDSDGSVGVAVAGGLIKTTSQFVQNGQWHHIAAVLVDDGTPSLNEIQLYIDGVLETNPDSNSSQSIATDNTKDLVMGAWFDSASSTYSLHFHGLIDDMRIYDTALDAEQIQEVMGDPFRQKVWVDDDYTSTGYNDGHTWGYDAFNCIQDGIDVVKASATVHVRAGTYLENVKLRNGIKLIGEGADVTVIDGNHEGAVVSASYCDSNTILEDFTIQNSKDIYQPLTGGGSSLSYGPGMWLWNSDVIVRSCVFADNSCSRGGGISIGPASDPTIQNCRFINNVASDHPLGPNGYGGAIKVDSGSSPIVNNCVFINNSATGSGGAIIIKAMTI